MEDKNQLINDLLNSSDVDNRILGQRLKEELRIEKQIKKNVCINEYKELQTKYPIIHAGGSLGLFLHGIKLKRWENTKGDLDIISPYYLYIEEKNDSPECFPSGCDFQECFIFENNGKRCKVDYRIDPLQRYDRIEFEGFIYNVSKLETIMEAKIRYSKRNQKHRDDVYEICKKTSKNYSPKKETKIEERTSDDLPF